MTTCIHGSRGESSKVEYEGFSILLSRFVATVDEFEKMNWYMERVDIDIVLEAINIFGENSMERSDVEHPEASKRSLGNGGR